MPALEIRSLPTSPNVLLAPGKIILGDILKLFQTETVFAETDQLKDHENATRYDSEHPQNRLYNSSLSNYSIYDGLGVFVTS